MKILIVEDEIGIVNFLQQGLEEEGYRIEVAHNGKEGLALALKGNFNLILLDWMLPEMTGLDVCKDFRKQNKKTPIIFLTAKDTVQETILGLQAGANDYIKKPFDFEELLARIKVQLRNAQKEIPLLTINDVQIDRSSHQVTKNNQIIPLTQKEYDLLILRQISNFFISISLTD